MNEINIRNTNILKQEMKAANSPSEAWTMGDAYFFAGEEEAYKQLNRAELKNLLHSATTLQKENGSIYLYVDPTMPSDARVDIIHKPSYAVAAIAIYAWQNHPEIFDEELKRFFRNLLEGAFSRGIIGHGIDAPETVRRTMLMLCKAGVRSFLETNEEQFPTFAEVIYCRMASFMAHAKRIDEEGIVYNPNVFSPESVNHLIKQLVACWNGNDRPVFVYGTLMKGERANHMLSSGEYAGRFLLKDYAMYNLGSFPGIKRCKNEAVLGELFFVDAETIARTDRYEGEGTLYTRKPVTLRIGDSNFSAETYVFNGDVTRYEKMREPWNAKADDLVWYAGYGSNLSQERFTCYISGGTCVENGKTYRGCSDTTPPRATRNRGYSGQMYFGNSSPSWGGSGVAFYDPAQRDECNTVHMKLYQITRQQFHDVQGQEGNSDRWYGRMVCLEVDNHGLPVYTLTSETPRPKNAPSEAYKNLIASALQKEFKLGKRQAHAYIEKWL